MVVIGGGAAGILAAYSAAKVGAKVILVEKTIRLGTKILISGGGKCNITHAGQTEDLLSAFRRNEAQFLRPSCYKYKNTDVLELLTSQGLEVYTRPDGCVFPVFQTAKDVVQILTQTIERLGVQIELNSQVTRIAPNGSAWQIEFRNRSPLEAETLVVTTGGSSYPKTGTTGDGWKWLRDLGHSIVPVRAALAPIELHEPLPIPGVALRHICLKAKSGGKEVSRWNGDLLFTHAGISGPCALGISREVEEAKIRSEVELEIDLVPDLSFEKLQDVNFNWAESNKQKLMASFPLSDIPDSFRRFVFEQAHIDQNQRVSNTSKRDFNRLTETQKHMKIGQVKRVPLEKGEVVAGGVSLKEVDPQTCESRLYPGLFLAGEVLDIAGPVGGYNLQAAFSTGFVAGLNAATRPVEVT